MRLLACLLYILPAFSAQPSTQLESLLERAYGKNEFRTKLPGVLRWVDGGSAYTLIEKDEIVRVDATTGAKEVLVTTKALTPKGATAPLKVDGYQWSEDRKRLLIYTNSKKVWRQNTRGDYWILQGNKLRKLGGDGSESSMMFAKFSPDGANVAFVRGNDLYVEDVDRATIKRLTSDGSPTSINGTSDWVNEEELSIRDGFRWSPDGKRIAFWHFDSTGVGDFVLVNNTAGLYPKLTHIPYPKVGTKNSATKVGVVSVAGGAPVWLNIPGDPREHYIPVMDWAANPDEVIVYRLNRHQNDLHLFLGHASSGKTSPILVEKDEAYVDLRPVTTHRWLDKGKSFLWLSERDGWQHAWRISRDGKEAKLLTRFNTDVVSLTAVDETRGWLYFIASPADATQRLLCRSKLDGTGTPERVTPENLPGTHAYQVSSDGKFAVHSYARFDTAPVYDVVSLPEHQRLRVLVDNQEFTQKLKDFALQPTEFFKVKLDDGLSIDGWMIKPRNLDASKRYPVLVHVYGEPANVTVLDAWSTTHGPFHRAIAAEGYVVVSLENRGTPAPKGRSWRKAGYGRIGVLSSDDQARALKALMKQCPYLDPARVAIWGWSGGGSNTLNALFRHPDVYQAGMSVAPVADQLLYDTIYQERYMGLPDSNAKGYKEGSPIHFAEGLKGDLLLLHGTGDDNVHYQGTERLINRLVELGKTFELMAYPNRTHAISEGPGTSLHVRRTLSRFLLKHIEPGPR